MKKVIGSIIITLFVLFLPLLLAVHFVPADAGMAVCLLFFYVVYPICSVGSGIYAGRNFKTLWYMPAVFALAFLLSVYLVFDTKDPAFLIYAGTYFLFSTAAMLVTFLTKRK
ncbi:MAG: hypothetical protein IJF61_06025 [Clostridia bacterium]|nr:hypothetical protein [Clostridia bacterium]